MKRIKLDAIDSTNDYLKALSKSESLHNFTIVTAVTQKKGRGQMGAKWSSESGKNLILSILIKDVITSNEQIFDLNVAIATAIIQTLEVFQIPNLAIKWPNDIMAEEKKIGGILIENSFKADKTIESIVGIGLNINQTTFYDLPNASSISNIFGKPFDLELILDQILKEIKLNCQLISDQSSKVNWNSYHHYLFKKNVPIPFETAIGTRFIGIIRSVSNLGKLEIEMKDKSIQNFEIKKLKMIF